MWKVEMRDWVSAATLGGGTNSSSPPPPPQSLFSPCLEGKISIEGQEGDCFPSPNILSVQSLPRDPRISSISFSQTDILLATPELSLFLFLGGDWGTPISCDPLLNSVVAKGRGIGRPITRLLFIYLQGNLFILMNVFPTYDFKFMSSSLSEPHELSN